MLDGARFLSAEQLLLTTLIVKLAVIAGVTARLLLNYRAADLSLEGALLAGLIAGPYAGALVGVLVGIPAAVAGEIIALPCAVGCGFAGGGLREACPKETIWEFTPFVFIDLPKHVWRMVRKLGFSWQVWLLLAPAALELLRQSLAPASAPGRLFTPAPSLGPRHPR